MQMEARNDSDAENAFFKLVRHLKQNKPLSESKFVSIHLIIAMIQWPGSATNVIFTAPFW